MIQFAHATMAANPRTKESKIAAYVYAGVLVVMAVAQLFSFEKFIPLIESYWLPGGYGTASLVAGIVVIAEVFAVPYLLRMPLSPLMRWFSLVCGLLVPIIWTILAISAISTTNALHNSGMLGTKIVIPAGWTQLFVSIALLGLATWSAWGLWPARKN